MNNEKPNSLQARTQELREISQKNEFEFIESIKNCSDNEHLRKLVLFHNDQVGEHFAEISKLELKTWDYQEYQYHLLGMLKWIKENFGDVDTSDFGNKNLAGYIDECLDMEKELFEKLK